MAVRQIEGMVSLQDDGGRQPSIELSTDWEVLGPFQIGTRGKNRSGQKSVYSYCSSKHVEIK